MTNQLKISLKKLVKLMVFFQINQKRKIMIALVMPLLKMVVEDKEDLEVLVAQIFQTFLKIFLVTLVVVEEALEDGVQTIEVLT